MNGPSPEILERALFVINHSGGKDSQAMTIRLRRLVPESRLVVVHATLGCIEWPGTIEHIQSTIGGLPLILARLASGKTLLDRVAERGVWPDPSRRWCTSDMKRGPIERALRHLASAPIRATLTHGQVGTRLPQPLPNQSRDTISLSAFSPS